MAFATETVYGLGADATNDIAVARIFEAKGRPQFNPLIVHVADLESARTLGEFNDTALALAEAFWPGALSIVVPRTSHCAASRLVSAGLDSIAIRVPSHAGAQDLLRRTGRPIAAPSANRSGRISPTQPEHVLASLEGRLDMVLDGGKCAIGLESTIVNCLGPDAELLRPGGVAAEDIERVLGGRLVRGNESSERPVAPGQQESHYAPNAQVRLEADAAGPDEALLAFGPDAPVGAQLSLNLSTKGDLREAAANLFDMLHQLDRPGIRAIAVMPIPETGLGLAINDRLRRAAAAR